jgi:excisionase family DNA binding protein
VAKDGTEYLTVEEAAVRAKVASITIRRAIKNGKLHYRAARGATKLLRASDVEEWVRQRTELREIDGGK